MKKICLRAGYPAGLSWFVDNASWLTGFALFYGVPTKAINLAVRRNAVRFPEDFMFQLTSQETMNLRFQIETSSWGGRRYRPYAFAEQASRCFLAF